MLTATQEKLGNATLFRLSGAIEESANFDQLLGPPPAELVINCKDVPRINSVGVKFWIKYFQLAQSKGTKLKLIECSTAIVEQINLISNFTCGAEVESIYVPFSCESCHKELIGLFKTTDLKALNLRLPELKCSKCGGKAVFDDIPEEYLGFLAK
jgi:anti-anti-sigma regulatory factor